MLNTAIGGSLIIKHFTNQTCEDLLIRVIHVIYTPLLSLAIRGRWICFADAGLVLSTRERGQLRDHLIKLGITKISAGSKTNPGGYTGLSSSVEQFEIDDTRSPAQVAAVIREQGFESVWKDWDSAFVKV